MKKNKLIEEINECKKQDKILMIRIVKGNWIREYRYFPYELNQLLYTLNSYDDNLKLIGTNQLIERWDA